MLRSVVFGDQSSSDLWYVFSLKVYSFMREPEVIAYKLNVNDAFTFPTTDGTGGQVLATDGSGTVAWTSLMDSDDQQLSISGNTLTLENGGSVDLSGYLDNTDAQALSLNSNTLSLEDGGSVDLSGYLDNTDNQDLSLTGNTLSLSGDATDVDLSGYLDNTDDQAISLNSNTLNLEDGGSVDLSAFANENTRIVQEADMDTKIQVEESADEDVIRFDVAGGEVFTIGKNANGVTVLEPKNSSNTILGENAGNNAGSIDYNTYIGYQAGNGNANYGNTFIGAEAGLSSEGYQNIFIGEGAGGTSTGNGNIFIGYEIGYGESGSNKLMIENEDYISPLIYGEFDNDLLRINGTLNVNNAYSFPAADGTNGQVLSTDGSGLLSWTTLTDNDSQTLSLTSNTLSLTNGGSVDLSAFANENTRIVQDADNDTKMQVEESNDEDIIRFDIGGSERWVMTGSRLEAKNTGSSIFIGQNSGSNDNLINGRNVYIGHQAGEQSTGVNNLYVGYQAGQQSTGSNNVFTGYQAGLNATSGQNNVFTGNSAGFSNEAGNFNTYVGSEAGQSNVSGNHNVMIGQKSGFNNTNNENVFIGSESGLNNTTGYGNVFIGRQAGYNETGSNKLYIDNSNTSAPLIYGDFINDLLRINGTLNVNNAYSFPAADGNNGQILVTDGSGSLSWSSDIIAIKNIQLNGNYLSNDGDNEGIYINNSGQVGIGTNNPAEQLTVSGNQTVTGKLTINTLQITGGSPGSGKVLTTDADGDATWQDNNSRVAFESNNTAQTLSGSLTSSAVSTNSVTNSLTLEAGDLVVVQATFSAQLTGGSGSDEVGFSIGMSNGSSTVYGGATAGLKSFENHRGKFAQVATQYTFTVSNAGTYTFRLYANMSNTDDDLQIDNVNISAIKF